MTGKIIMLLAVLSAAVMLTGCGRAKIDPNDYLELRFSGLDTAAAASCCIDYRKMVTDNLRAFGIKSPDDVMGISRAEDELRECLGGAPDRDLMLSNGDIVTFAWDRGELERLEKEYRIRLCVSDKEVTVRGLDQAKRFDPFDFLDVGFLGTEPEGEVNLVSRLPVRDIVFSADRFGGLSNGDRIKVSFGSGSEEQIKEECFAQGFVPLCFEKEYTVSGLGRFVKKLRDIDSASYKKMDRFAQEELEKLSGAWTDKKLEGAKLLGAELYTPAEGEAKWGRNALCYVYEVTAEICGSKPKDSKTDKKESIKYYYFTYFLNVYVPDSGGDSPFPAECAGFPSYSEFYTSIYGDAFKAGDVVFEGFRTLDELDTAMADRFAGSVCETDIKGKQ